MRRTIIITAAFIMVLAAAAGASDFNTALQQAQAEYSKGNYSGTIEKVREAMIGVWNQAPLTVRDVTFVKEEPQAYGMYIPRGNNVFESVEPVLIYCEPVGYTVNKQGSQYHFAMAADFHVVDSNGKILGGQRDFGKWAMKSRAFNSEFMMFFTFNLKGLPAGKYTLVITLRDKNSDKSAEFSEALVIR